MRKRSTTTLPCRCMAPEDGTLGTMTRGPTASGTRRGVGGRPRLVSSSKSLRTPHPCPPERLGGDLPPVSRDAARKTNRLPEQRPRGLAGGRSPPRGERGRAARRARPALVGAEPNIDVDKTPQRHAAAASGCTSRPGDEFQQLGGENLGGLGSDRSHHLDAFRDHRKLARKPTRFSGGRNRVKPWHNKDLGNVSRRAPVG